MSKLTLYLFHNFLNMLFELFLAFFLVCILIQCIHLLIILLRFSRYVLPDNSAQPPVSIIVCAHDEEENLKVLLPILTGQEYPSYEIIIIDDRSNDGTHDLLLEASANHKKLRYITVEHLPDHMNGKKYGITLAVKAARHDHILLTDADCKPSGKDWISEMIRGFDDSNSFVLGHSMYIQEKGFLNLFIRYETLWTAIHFLSAAMGGHPYMGTGRNLAYRKSTFLENKGFRGFGNIVGGDDDLLVNRYGNGTNTGVVISGKSITYSVPKRSWQSFYLQKIRHLSVGKYYRPTTRFKLGVLSLSHIFGLVLFPALLLVPVLRWYALGGYLLRTMLLHITLDKTGRILQAKVPNVWISILDWVYIGYFIIVGMSATFTKRIRWK
jgi:cellulose synthase/poly-beta-1,6-N-acetylglucosamine synthase-like glycosyltransferase